MKKNLLLFLLLSIFAFVIYGCSDSGSDDTGNIDNTDNTGNTGDTGSSDDDSDDSGITSYDVTADDRDDILDAFTEELIKYTTFEGHGTHIVTEYEYEQGNSDDVRAAFVTELKNYVTDNDGVKYTETISDEDTAASNLEAIYTALVSALQESMNTEDNPIDNALISRTIARMISGDLEDLLYYSLLSGEQGSFETSLSNFDFLGSLSTSSSYTPTSALTKATQVINNAASILYFVDQLETKLNASGSGTINEDYGRANIVYMVASIINYLTHGDTGIKGINTDYMLPNDTAFLSDLADAFYNANDYVQSLDSWNIDYTTNSFTVMPILSGGLNYWDSGFMDTMYAFMEGLTDVFVLYDYATWLTTTGIANLETILSDIEATASEVLYAEIARNIAREASGSLGDVLYSSVLEDNDMFSTVYDTSLLEVGSSYSASVITKATRMVDNAKSIIGFTDYLESYYSDTKTDNGRANMIYMAASLVGYLDDQYMSGLAEHYVLPNDSEFLQAFAEAFYNANDYIQNYSNWDVDYVSDSFTVMPILSGGLDTSDSAFWTTMLAFMSELFDIFVEYGYATASE